MPTTLITRFFRWIRTQRITRFEFLLPTTDNDGTAIELEKFDLTARELGQRFGGVSQDIVHVRGTWHYKGTIYRDELIRLRIDTADPEAIPFLKAHKKQLKARFKQLDIWITAQQIEII